MSDLSRVEQLLRNVLGEDIYEVTPQSRVEVLLQELNELIEGMGGSVSVSGTTPTIVAKSGIRYVCGEVATLDFTPSATGICDVLFTSGTTPTVLSLPNTVKMPSWFTVEANKTYEISILDGVYGAVMSWT